MEILHSTENTVPDEHGRRWVYRLIISSSGEDFWLRITQNFMTLQRHWERTATGKMIPTQEESWKEAPISPRVIEERKCTTRGSVWWNPMTWNHWKKEGAVEHCVRALDRVVELHDREENKRLSVIRGAEEEIMKVRILKEIEQDLLTGV